MITWSDNYLMGIEQFDREHRQIFKLAGQILERMRTRDHEAGTRLFVVREAIIYLNSYFENHVQQEEAYMREIGYAGYAMHKELHDEFRRKELAKYQKIIESGECKKEDVWDFLGTGIGWLLEHIATADLAIVGKGVLAEIEQPKSAAAQEGAGLPDEAALEREINLALAAILNTEMNAKISNPHYAGESFGQAIHHKIVYSSARGKTTVIAGIERSFVLDVARMLYGEDIDDEMDLIMSTLDIFGTHFWATLGRRFVGDAVQFSIQESSFIIGSRLPQELEQLKPTTSVLFSSNKGKFYVASDAAYPQ